MAHGYEDFSGVVEVQGQFNGQPTTVQVDGTGILQTAWVD